MMGLVDYGSDSESDKEKNEESGKSHIVNEEFHDSIEVPDLATSSHYRSSFPISGTEGILEDIVKQKSWEKRIAKRERKRMKKAKKEKSNERNEVKNDEYLEKTQLKDPEKKTKAKTKIPAFGAVGLISTEDNDSDNFKTSRGLSSPLKKGNASGLIAMLPAPKAVFRKCDRTSGGATNFLLPSSLNTKKSSTLPKVSGEKDDEKVDFFGLSLASGTKLPSLDQVSAVPSTCKRETLDPSVKTEDYIHPSQMWNFADSSVRYSEHGINMDEEMGPKYPERGTIQYGNTRHKKVNPGSSIVDVHVDDALDDDVRSTLLKNINSRALAKQAMAPLPKAKTIKDQAAKRKHQITYLANLAVAREEALQEQWAENRQMKKMAKQKYGF